MRKEVPIIVKGCLLEHWLKLEKLPEERPLKIKGLKYKIQSCMNYYNQKRIPSYP